MFRFAVVLLSVLTFVSTEELPKNDSRIVGGREVGIQENPHICSMQRWGSHFCGVALIAPNMGLTAAHCLYEFTKPGVSTVDARGLNLGLGCGNALYKNGVKYPIKKVIVHPSYNNVSMQHDIALVETATPVQFNGYTQAITILSNINVLKANLYNQPGCKCQVAGWGVQQEGSNSVSEKLKATCVKITDANTCKQKFRQSYIQQNMICGEGEGGITDSCQGDSGGPLVCTVQGMKFTVGVVSFGIGCARPGHPGMYTDLSEYQDWIKSKCPESDIF